MEAVANYDKTEQLTTISFTDDRLQVHSLSLLLVSLLGPAVSFFKIVGGPEGLKIGEVAGDWKLCRVGEVERLQGPNVVEVPKVAILPRHSRQELALKVGSKFAQSAT